MLFLLIVVLSAKLMVAQEPAPMIIEGHGPATGFDAAKVAAAIRASYYHPDELSGLDCDVSVDWEKLFTGMKVTVPPERLRIIQAVKVRSRATRGKRTEVDFNWSGETLDTKDQVEDGFRQMLGGFYQMYWSMLSSSLVGNGGEITKIESTEGGGSKASFTSPNMNMILMLDKEDIPTHYDLDGPLMKGTIDVHYVRSPAPAPGDLRRISGLDVSQQIGTSAMNVQVSLDYQSVGGFQIPQNVLFKLVGAYSLELGFSSCTVSQEVQVKAP
jgi:hypothetical protein